MSLIVSTPPNSQERLVPTLPATPEPPLIVRVATPILGLGNHLSTPPMTQEPIMPRVVMHRTLSQPPPGLQSPIFTHPNLEVLNQIAAEGQAPAS